MGTPSVEALNKSGFIKITVFSYLHIRNGPWLIWNITAGGQRYLISPRQFR